MALEQFEKYFSDDAVEAEEILDMMLLNLQNSFKLSDRFMSGSTIKLLYVYLMKNYTSMADKNTREKIASAVKPINDMINNHFLNSIVEWTEMKLNKRPNRKDMPPISIETRKIMEAKAIKMDTALQKKYQRTEADKKKTRPRKFKINDIVGVKDKEHKWNMARVLLVVDDDDFHTPWYYVHFHNWDTNFREWIGDANRIKPYLPQRDYFRK